MLTRQVFCGYSKNEPNEEAKMLSMITVALLSTADAEMKMFEFVTEEDLPAAGDIGSDLMPHQYWIGSKHGQHYEQHWTNSRWTSHGVWSKSNTDRKIL